MVYLFVGIAGIIGALLRYYFGVAVHSWWHSAFPLSTLLPNIIGCFVLGWITTYLSKIDKIPSNLITAFGTGLIGSFTTFSTFSVEAVQLLEDSRWYLAITYILISIWGGLLMAWGGFRFGRYHIRKSISLKGGNK
ncbi:fluoride efflux transporter CrcB [Bacillus sp. FJAT-49736]|uniref:fluoride efflux transporter CrcB n=1 Tax=Bacillus sp. FJAT-49736 TaxID=2833582 RepID=UPI001BC9AC11|nr:fluoride efflux transporter CrcB [Bacillus sp. FJAT-49736]MBS4171843.1 fluoride efflux transporter CrcB [Bacillus sp. FJAT-49736]